jgi:hypothetical protein
MTHIKMGSRWSGGDGKIFTVIGTMIIEDKNWVYYRAEKPKDHHPSEYSCFEESFLARFRSLPE